MDIRQRIHMGPDETNCDDCCGDCYGDDDYEEMTEYLVMRANVLPTVRG